MKQSVVFALGSYLPRTYTWVYNQLRFFKKVHVLILAWMLNPDRVHFPVNKHKIFTFPGFEALKKPKFHIRVIRRFLRLIFVDSYLDSLVFAWKIKKSKCSLIHAHFADVGWKFIPIAKMLNVPLIVSFYGLDYDWLPNTKPRWKRRYRKLFQYGSLFLTEGEYGRKRLIEKGVSLAKTRKHHLGVDVDSIPFKIRFLAQDEIFRLVQVASFVEKKGHRILIEAIRLLNNKGIIENISLTLIGDGLLKQKIINLMEQYNLKKYITFINHVPYENLHKELLKYHMFIHPSLTTSDGDCEGGAPVVFLDAQATGMPVISTFHCDIPEEVIHDKTGFLVPEYDSEALASAILKFINEPELLPQYGTAGRKHMEENYSAKKQAGKLTNIYSDMIRD